MPEQSDPVLRVRRFVRGVESRDHVIVRLADAPRYLCLSQNEIAALDELSEHPVDVGEFLGRHLGGHANLDLKAAVSLLVRLHQAHFIVDAEGLQARLKEAAGKVAGDPRRVVSLLTALLDTPLVTFRDARIHDAFRLVGRTLIGIPLLAAASLLVVGLGVYSGMELLPSPALLTADLAAPESLFVKAFIAFSVAASWTAFLQMAALAGTGVRFIGASLRVTALSVLRLAVDDADAFMLPKRTMLRYQLFVLLSPWLSALVAWQLTGIAAVAALASLTAGAFALIGIGMLCPLWRSPLVKIGESYLARLGLLERANAHLAGGLISGLWKGIKSVKDRGSGPQHAEHAAQLWLGFYATVTIFWLYGMCLLFSDVLLGAAADLFIHLLHVHSVVRTLASALLLLVMVAAVALPLLRLVMIPLQNLVAAASLPLTRARRGIGAFYDKSLPPSAAVTRFLREIPVLGHLSDEQLQKLTATLRFRSYGAGQRIISKGEEGREFFILADGSAEVVLGGRGVPEEVVDHLVPGDSFGEIALIEKVRRTATIRTTTPAKVLVLEKPSFDQLFPADSEARARLTSMIRQVKLVLESQALSHLAPRQIRELLKHCQFVELAAGDLMIRENTIGDAAYLIERGEVQVMRGNVQVAKVGRGELVGAISLIKDVRRTATVQVVTPVRALRIDKETFLKMCMANVFVALLVADLADRQIEQTHLRAG